MKVTIYILLSLLIVAGCDSVIDSNKFVSSTGFIKKIEASTWQYGTHTLNNNQGRVLYALKSKNHDLDDYNDEKVNISGYIVEGYPVDGGPEYIDVRTIKIIR